MTESKGDVGDLSLSPDPCTTRESAREAVADYLEEMAHNLRYPEEDYETVLATYPEAWGGYETSDRTSRVESDVAMSLLLEGLVTIPGGESVDRFQEIRVTKPGVIEVTHEKEAFKTEVSVEEAEE